MCNDKKRKVAINYDISLDVFVREKLVEEEKLKKRGPPHARSSGTAYVNTVSSKLRDLKIHGGLVEKFFTWILPRASSELKWRPRGAIC